MTMVERVARALYGHWFSDEHAETDFTSAPKPIRDLWISAAQTAIEAMREPTLEMRKVCRFETAEIEYPAMIDAALKEKT